MVQVLFMDKSNLEDNLAGLAIGGLLIAGAFLVISIIILLIVI